MYENKAKRQLGTVIGVIALIFMVVPSIFIDANAPRAKLDDRVVEKTVQTTDLLSLQLSKEQVESSSFEGRTGGSILGNVGYVQQAEDPALVPMVITVLFVVVSVVFTLRLLRNLRVHARMKSEFSRLYFDTKE